jgi:hypothetical protein
MAGTSFDTIHDMSLISFNDYKLTALYSSSLTNFKIIMDNYLLKSISLFTNCLQDLTAYSLTTRTFTATLTLAEQMILSNLEVITWMDAHILDIRQMNNVLSDSDFKLHSQAQNLTAKMNAQNILREKVSQQMMDYGLKGINWTEWGEGTFI